MIEQMVQFDEDGRATVTSQGVIELAYRNQLPGIFDWKDLEKQKQYKEVCELLDNEPFEYKDFAQHNTREWFTPPEYSEIDLKSYLQTRCSDSQQWTRAQQELEIVQRLNAEPIFKHLIYLVDVWRSNNMVWGVGRGSSVSCFLLYLIGLNKINPLDYDLDHREFFKV